jgi:hypothetical protein
MHGTYVVDAADALPVDMWPSNLSPGRRRRLSELKKLVGPQLLP